MRQEAEMFRCQIFPYRLMVVPCEIISSKMWNFGFILQSQWIEQEIENTKKQTLIMFTTIFGDR